MPNGIYPHPRSRPPAHHSAGLALRVWWQTAQLDEALARGADAASDPALNLRAQRLTGAAERVRLADGLEAVLRSADRRSPHFSVRLTPRRQAVQECAGDLRGLVNRLRDGAPIDVQGAAMVARLLTDGASPLYYAHAPRSLRHAVRSARHTLDPVVQIAVARAAA